MSRFGYAIATTLIVDLFAVLFVVVAWFPPHPRLIWNASASAPIGLYRVTAVDRPKVGDLVAITPPTALARFMAERHYLPINVPLLKQVATRPGARFCRNGDLIAIDGVQAAIAKPRDRAGRPLPVWSGCRIVHGDELVLLNPAPDSMDSRYFGPVPVTGLIGRATPILTRDTPDAPLCWRIFGDISDAPHSIERHSACR